MSEIKCFECGKIAEAKSAEEMRGHLRNAERRLRALWNLPPGGEIIVLCEACAVKMKKAKEPN